MSVFFKKKIKKLFSIPEGLPLTRASIIRSLSSRWQRFYYKKKYTNNELICILKKMGMHEGSCVFIHSSWDSFFNYEGSPKDFIKAIIEFIGPEGTLAMPAFPYLSDRPLDLKKSITGAGLIAEQFRRYPGVKRSINTQHSVCAIGKLSDYLLSEHQYSKTCWDEKSPFYKLSKVGAIVLCLGVGYSFMGTVVHCVESINREQIKYYSDFFTKEQVTHYYIDYDGIMKEYKCYDMNVNRVFNIVPEKFFLKRYFSDKEYKTARLSNLTIMVFYADKYIPKLIELGKKGIDVYRSPSKKGYKF